MSSSEPAPRGRVSGLVDDERMHREFTLPATATHDTLTVSYADVGRRPSPSELGLELGTNSSTVLFIPGMFASRYVGVPHLHAIAEELGVRVLVVDRPGMGKSTDVPLEQRVSVWVELIPLLLQHLGIKHVSLVSHSAGTIFLFNTLLRCRDVLHPERPYVALLAPWVDVVHSKVTAMQAAQLVPVGAFGVWNLLPKFFVTQAGPAFASSGSIFTKLSSAVSRSWSRDEDQDQDQDQNATRLERDYGVPPHVAKELRESAAKSMFAESTVGANSEAMLVLKKGVGGEWGACKDYGAFVRQLANSEQERRAGTEADRSLAKLKVRVYFAESDAMTGKRGQEYMAICFKGQGDGVSMGAIDFAETTVAGTNHDSLIDRVTTIEEILVEAGGHLPRLVS